MEKKYKASSKKKMILGIVTCILSVFLFSACGKEKISVFLEAHKDEQGKYDVQGNYDVKEIDLEQVGINTPGGVCCYDGNIYVCDIANNCIVKLSKDLVREESYGTLGMEEGNFSKPQDITFSGNCFYVLDNGNSRIQKFDADFRYQETYYLAALHCVPAMYMSIAVDEGGAIYVTTNAADEEDAFVHCLEDGQWNKIGGEIVGYLCAGDGNVYFAKQFEFIIEEKATITQSGENILYVLQDGGLKPLAQIMNSYAPSALTYQDGCFYMISSGYRMVNRFSQQDENFDTLFFLPRSNTCMYMDIDEAGNLYITDVENKCFYVAEKQEG